jgi:hypothetical protein
MAGKDQLPTTPSRPGFTTILAKNATLCPGTSSKLHVCGPGRGSAAYVSHHIIGDYCSERATSGLGPGPPSDIETRQHSRSLPDWRWWARSKAEGVAALCLAALQLQMREIEAFCGKTNRNLQRALAMTATSWPPGTVHRVATRQVRAADSAKLNR